MGDGHSNRGVTLVVDFIYEAFVYLEQVNVVPFSRMGLHVTNSFFFHRPFDFFSNRFDYVFYSMY